MDGDHMKFDPIDDRYIYDVVSKNIKYFRLHNNSKYLLYMIKIVNYHNILKK